MSHISLMNFFWQVPVFHNFCLFASEFGMDGAGQGIKFLVVPLAAHIVLRMVHTGIGYDVHQLVAGRKLILGGVEIPHGKGLEGHSDADVLMHAVCDAILGALGEEDIGHFFPNTDPRWKGAPSKVFLEEAAKRVSFHKGRLVNVDATIIAQQPKVYPHLATMKANLAAALGIPVRRIGIKATTNEHMGFIGREEGIAAMAVAAVDLPET
jgi:2-C-methyl-D-erythritol 2,4-cyclodiphosphate synthase